MSTLEDESDRLPAGKLLYTGKVHTTGGRERGVARSCDGNLDIRLSTPGAGGSGSNPEQLLAAGWSACFEGAIDLAARKNRITLPADLRSEERSVGKECVRTCRTGGAPEH